MRNLELKARIESWDEAETAARGLPAAWGGEWRQVDTYFRAPQGRLKLREVDGAPAELIAYERPEQTATRWSDYLIAPVENGPALRDVLTRALGVRAQVNKIRRLYVYRSARIHLDRVERLGAFVEFEVVCADGDEVAAAKLMGELMQAFALNEKDALRLSYSDMLESGL